MRTMTTLALAFTLLGAPLAARAQTYEIDGGHSHVGFSVRHMMVSNVRGAFKKVEGTVVVDDKAPAKSSVQAVIDAASVDTGDAKRDEHLRAADFFDVAKHPTLTFKSKRIIKAGKSWKVTGDLTMHGVTKEVTLDATAPSAEVKDPWGGLRSGLTATTTLDRKDFGITYNRALDNGGLAVGDEVKVQLELELVRKPNGPTAAK
jgi:polyisoprenoid-binding protein YceI